MPRKPPQIATPRWQSFVKSLSGVLSRHVVPLFIDHGGVPRLHGSATLIELDKTTYLITAAHVLDPLKEGTDIFFYVEKSTTQKITGRAVLTELRDGASRADDNLDIGVVRLDGPMKPPYRSIDKFAVGPASLKPSCSPRDNKEYLLVGVPWSQTKLKMDQRSLNMKLYSFRNGSIPESKYSEVGADPTVHIALGFDQRKVVSEAGSYANGPNPQGLSGAPLWLIYDESDIVDPLNPPIVAVVTEHRRQHKIILATDIAVVLEAIENVA